ncbi:HypA protein [Xylaria intraflava]|nr:HypA protein [Xylaria intraflava]
MVIRLLFKYHARINSIANHTLNRHLRTMATSRIINITTDNTGLSHGKPSEAAAKKVTQLLQDDLEKHHCFFNQRGFHDHISHHLLSLYAIGGTAEQIQTAYDDNSHYQRSLPEARASEIEVLHDFEEAKKKLGNEAYYPDFLVFFQNEIDKKGWQAVLSEYLFKGDERSDDLLFRMFGGELTSAFHPIIQLMFGIEWQQPAIIAMGLAQAAVHKDEMTVFLQSSEAAAKASTAPMPEITSLYKEAAANEKLSTACRPGDFNKLPDGVIKRAFDDAVRISAKVNVKPEEVEEKTIEMYNAAIYIASGAAIRAGKEPRFDFFLMHHITVAPIFIAINAQPWIPTAVKARLLEWKIRLDILEYPARACPEVSLEKIISYVPKPETQKPLADLISRVQALHDDGHVSKLIRAIAICEEAGKPYEDKPAMKIKGALWTKVNQLVVEGAEGDGPTWVRDAGLAEAWKDIPDRK